MSSVYYLPDGGLLRASRFALTTGTPDLGADGGLEFQTNLPYFRHRPLHPATTTSCPKAGLRDHQRLPGGRDPPTRSVTGRDTLTSQGLCAANADGLALYIGQHGAHPPISVASLFRDHLRLLGANPANWTTKPIG